MSAFATLRHVTIAGPGGGQGVTAATMAIAGMAMGATVMLEDSVITGFAQHIRANGSDCGPLPGCMPALANVTTARSAYDPAKTMTLPPANVTHGDPITADPRLRDDLVPRHDSPLIDAAAAAGAKDAWGRPRTVDGDGTAATDVGALEYQRRAPVIGAATATPARAGVGAPIAFSASASDPDDEAISAVWAFSDGTTATGFDVSHAFGAAGAARATVTVTDAAGATATATVGATIDGATTPPGGDPPSPRRAAPAGLRLRAAQRRDRRAPYRFELRGKLLLPAGVPAAGCADGKVRLSIRAGKRTLARTVTLKADCSFATTVALGRKRARRVVVTAEFAGTPALSPRTAKALKLRAG